MGYIKKHRKSFFPLIVFLLINGCATVNQSYLDHNITVNKASAVILKVPVIEQKRYYCGPAALASVLAYWGTKQSQEEIAKQIFNSGLRGVLNIDLERYAKESGFWAESSYGEWADIKKNLGQDIPVIVIEKLHPYFLNRLHYVVVVGFDAEDKIIITQTGKSRYVIRSYAGFFRNWQAAGGWMLIVVPLEKVDWDLSESRATELGLMLEERGLFKRALQYYQKALGTSPDNAVILFNIGNIYTKMDLWSKAESVYMQAIKLKPDFADCYNNLANIYLKQGNGELAHRFVDEALTLSTQNYFFYLDTKAEIFFRQGDFKQTAHFFGLAENKTAGIEKKKIADFYRHWARNFGEMGDEQKARVLQETADFYQKIN